MRALAVALAVIVCAGCKMGTDYRRPDLGVPATHRDARADGASLAERDWREVFPDPQLQSLIDQALKSNPDLLVAAARVREAEAQVIAARAPGLPNASAILRTTPIARQPGDTLTSSFLGGLSLSWELDFWGRYARATEAARADLLGTVWGRRGVEVQLVAGVATQYHQIDSLHELERITRNSIQLQRDSLKLVKRLADAGVSSAAEVRQSEAQLATTEARMPGIERDLAAAENALSLLLGTPPAALQLPGRVAVDLPGALPAGLPSSLLERRPDILQAEARLTAANARVGEAKALFFPTISLTGTLGKISTSLSDVVTGSAPSVVSLGANVVQPLYNGRSIVANRDAAIARLEQAAIGYRKSVLVALGEVADSLKQYDTRGTEAGKQAERAAASREALRLADLRFRSGITSYLEVLDAQRQVLAAETDLEAATFNRKLARVQFYRALGGGWGEGERGAAVPPGRSSSADARAKR